MHATAITLKIPAMTLQAKRWAHPNGYPTLALHGWLDNAASFDLLAPYLTDLDIVCIDLPGHGLSDHRPKGCYFHMMDWVIEMAQVIECLGWSQFILLGHSLGASIATLMAGTFSEQVLGLIALDALGPMVTPEAHAPFQFKIALNDWLHASKPSSSITFEAIEHAALARQKVAPISFKGAMALAQRGLKRVEGGRWRFRTDPRLLNASVAPLTEGQTQAFIQAIEAPTCVVRPEPGFPFDPQLIQQRVSQLKRSQLIKIEGDHHVHLDRPQDVAKGLTPFIQSLKAHSKN